MSLNNRFKVPVSLLILSLAGSVAVAQTPVPPMPTLTSSAVKTVWPVAFNAQATNAAQSTRIAALETMVARHAGVTAQPSSTATSRPTATATATATKVATPQPSPTHAMPMPTTNPAACLNCVQPSAIVVPPSPEPDVRGQTCPAWAHDQWLVLAENGRMYRTWHPAVQPEDKAGKGCRFDHDHGLSDPRASKADPTLPAYGYAADLHGMAEPHVGFKTFVAFAGQRNDFEGFSSTADIKVTFHQGTLGAGRVAQRMHSFEFDLKHANGTEIHVEGMGDTGGAGNQCNAPDQEQGTIGVKLFGLPQSEAKRCNLGTPYEVWEFVMQVGENRVHSSLGTFDPITVLNPNTGVLEQTALTWPHAPFSGCEHDVYFGPLILEKAVDFVDAHGLRQVVKIGAKSFPLDTVGKGVFKTDYRYCESGPYTSN